RGRPLVPRHRTAIARGREGDRAGEEDVDPGPPRSLSRGRRRSIVAAAPTADRRVQRDREVPLTKRRAAHADRHLPTRHNYRMALFTYRSAARCAARARAGALED